MSINELGSGTSGGAAKINDANVLVRVTSIFPIAVLFLRNTATLGLPGTEFPFKSYTPGAKL